MSLNRPRGRDQRRSRGQPRGQGQPRGRGQPAGCAGSPAGCAGSPAEDPAVGPAGPRAHRPLRIGLTGGVGSGKSTVAAILRGHSAAIVDSDVIAREVVRPDGPAYAGVVEAFGPSVVAPDRTIDRKALAARVFADAGARARLNALTHPHIRRRTVEEGARLAADPGTEVIVFDIPLLLDTTDGKDLDLDGIIVVYADAGTRVRRLVARDGLSDDEASRRLAAQVRLEDKLSQADWVIDNSGTPDETAAQVDQLWRMLTARAREGRPSGD